MAQAFNQTTWEAEKIDLLEFKSSLVYIVSQDYIVKNYIFKRRDVHIFMT